MSIRDYERQQPGPYQWLCAHCQARDSQWRTDYEMALALGGAHVWQSHGGATGPDDLHVVSRSEMPPDY